MSCSSAFLALASSDKAGATSCSAAGGYDFAKATAPISGSQATAMCSVAACHKVVVAIKGQHQTECTYKSASGVTLYLYEDILSPIAVACGYSTARSARVPAPGSPVTKTPTTNTPTPTTNTPTTSTTPTTSSTPSTTTGNPSTPSGGSTPSSNSSLSNNGGSAGSDISSGSIALTPTTPGKDDSAASQIGGVIKDSENSVVSTPVLSKTFYIALVMIGVFAIIGFVLGRRRRRRNAKPVYVDPEFGQVGEGYATNGTYIPYLATTTASAMSETTFDNTLTVPIDVTGGAVGLWSDRAIQNARIPLEDIQLGQVLSAGAFGEVFSALYNGQQVAVKRLLPARRNDMIQIECFLEEAKLMTTLRHQRIVRLVGVAWDSLTDLCVVTELMTGGDLRTLLAGYASRNAAVGFNSDTVKIALHVAHALSYLHGVLPVVVHRDLKSKNILLTDTLDAKLTDFGVSRERAELTMTGGVGTSLWMAPEIMMGERYDEKADIFSFGVVLSELDTHRLPYADAMEPTAERQLSAMAILNMVSQGKLEVTFSEGANADMVAIGRACTSIKPQDRPSANDVLRKLQHIGRSYEGIV